MLQLRPHHSLCMQFYVGKAYSPDFGRNMEQKLLLPEDTELGITFGLDDLCAHCPNHRIHDDSEASPAIVNSDLHSSPVIGNSDLHPSPVIVNSDLHSSPVIVNSDLHSSPVIGNSDLHSSPAIGNSDLHSSPVIGNSDLHSSPVIVNSDLHSSPAIVNSDLHSSPVIINSDSHSSSAIDICDSEAHVSQIDRRVADLFGYEEGSRMTLKDFFQNSREKIILSNRLEEMCGECDFMDICKEQAKIIRKRNQIQ